LRVHDRRIFQPDSVEITSLETCPAGGAGGGLDLGLKAAGNHEFFYPVSEKDPIHTTIVTTIADEMTHLLAVADYVDQPFFLAHLQQTDGFFFIHLSSGSPFDRVFRRPINLEADLHGFSTFPVDRPAGAFGNRKVLGRFHDSLDVLES
jgi:hypothetical protein